MEEKVKYIPIICMWLSLVSAWYPFNFFPAGEVVGYSMLVCVYFYYKTPKENQYIRDCVIGLFLMNIVSCFKNETNYLEWKLYYDSSLFVVAHFRLIRYARKN